MTQPSPGQVELSQRGPWPVGVRTVTLTDEARARTLPIEVWYPASPAHAGRDLAADTRDSYQVFRGLTKAWQAAVRDATPRPGAPAPVVLFSHGLGGHRRQSTFICTHLASHGYAVAAPDHVGNTIADVFGVFTRLSRTSDMGVLMEWVGRSVRERPEDLAFVLDRLADGALPELAATLGTERVGLLGHSFGAWTVLTRAAREPRAQVVVGLAPAGGAGAYVNDPLPANAELDWPRPLPTLFVIGDADSICPPASTRELFSRVGEPKRLVELADVDHMHFLDDAQKAHELFRLMPGMALVPAAGPIREWPTLAPAAATRDRIRALVLEHLAAHLPA